MEKKSKKTSTKKSAKKTIKKIDTLIQDKEYKSAEKLYKNKQYNEAYDKYISLFDKYPKNKKIYKRLIECLTKDYTFKDNSRDFKHALDEYITTYKILCTKSEQTYLEKRLEEYKNVKGNKSRFLLIAFLGIFGVHKFLDKKYLLGILYLFTFGIFGIGVIIDLISDYAEYEDDLKLDIFRYIISILIVAFAVLRHNTTNYYFFIIAAILFMPIVFSDLLKFIPKIIKIVALIVLCFFGFRTVAVVESVPVNLIGTWKTNNEYTNYKSINIKTNTTTIKFNDREKETGKNIYDKEKKILKVSVNETTYYRFKYNKEDKVLCIYNESDSCLISFTK